MSKEYSFVIDANGKRLDPTIVQNAWRLVRQKKAVLVSKYPMTIQLAKVVENENRDEIRVGIDDGAEHVGIALVQKCQTRNKVLLKATMEHRSDVGKKMTIRRAYRRYHRCWKRHRPARFDNRGNSRKAGRLAPSIKQKRQAVIRVAGHLAKLVRIDGFRLEDVAIDIRALTDGYKPYRWQYQRSNRLDENLRKAAILRDGGRCRECGKENCRLEVHHITTRRTNGRDTISNLITLCPVCHDRTKGREEQFAERYYAMLGSKGNPNGLKYAAHVMAGKTWLRAELAKRAPLALTTGGDTANKRIDWNIAKTHSNDAVCITGLKPENLDVQEWTLKPIRHQSKGKASEVLGFHHHDIVAYTFKNGERYEGYVTAMYPEAGKRKAALNFQSPTKHCKRVNARKCRLIYRPSKIFWLRCA
ncbi:MAG: RNA-guided endonuclease IscB [Selenomonas sp.]|uniref:RNA-guided endonuclease IscB n=1 Tax=Selenomonas sp. TaxID=2053611 RepID=UPI0025EA0927|nr:RNA-guided endonuclease IscB [Selenomonas sp.]MCI6101243.1 RNA-guided endonuclease IscB [Selenomonas sp.]MCI6232343.1 RNA-guided endonuclease IscB [Selenomonas sp.]